jgi:hypothetical protein
MFAQTRVGQRGVWGYKSLQQQTQWHGVKQQQKKQ